MSPTQLYTALTNRTEQPCGSDPNPEEPAGGFLMVSVGSLNLQINQQMTQSVVCLNPSESQDDVFKVLDRHILSAYSREYLTFSLERKKHVGAPV